MFTSTCHREANTAYHLKYLQRFLSFPEKHSVKISACPCQPFIERPTLTTWNTDNGSWSCQQNAVRRFLHLHVWNFRRECNIDHLKLLATIPGAFGGNHCKTFQYVHVRLSWRINWAPTTWLSRWQRDTFLPGGVPTPHGVWTRRSRERSALILKQWKTRCEKCHEVNNFSITFSFSSTFLVKLFTSLSYTFPSWMWVGWVFWIFLQTLLCALSDWIATSDMKHLIKYLLSDSPPTSVTMNEKHYFDAAKCCGIRCQTKYFIWNWLTVVAF